MNAVAACALRLLEAHPDPALRLSELLPSVAERVDRSLTATRLRHALAEHPDLFRLLDPWQGPWRSVLALPSEPTLGVRERAFRASGRADPPADPDGDVWVVLLTHRNDPGAAGARPAATLSECVRWLARGVDPRSAAEVSRWYAMVLTERESRRALARRVA